MTKKRKIGQYTVDKNVPIPKRNWRHKYPFSEMEVGESVLIEDVLPLRRVRNAAANIGKAQGKKFVTRSEGTGIRVWRVE